MLFLGKPRPRSPVPQEGKGALLLAAGGDFGGEGGGGKIFGGSGKGWSAGGTRVWGHRHSCEKKNFFSLL
ncbi:hypothetical protein [Kamptonema formosum]|uniref:hypothetical protein n=1 Tax=Kamptonema formosum TaxID=331992 RepID=UPI0012DEA0EE|nr:hypothetical protein [Oscillatoria sp. PCC 10802]